MTDYAGFVHGGVQYPLPNPGIGGPGATLLRDCDPTTFYILEFFKSVIETHLSGRFLAEVAQSGANQVSTMVGETLPLNPEPYLTEEHIHFPLLAAYRKSTKYTYLGHNKTSIDHFDVVYVLPPMHPGEAERLMPILRSVVGVLDNRTEQGADPAYAPSAPAGTLGDSAWTRAGIQKAEVTGASYGGYSPSTELFFPAVLITLEVAEQYALATSDFEELDGADIDIDHVDGDQTSIEQLVQVSIYPAPVLTGVSPNNATKAGGTAITLTGTDFRVGTLYQVRFGGVPASAVAVLSTTTITCLAPAHAALPTFMADVEVEDIYGQVSKLIAGFTFTTP